MGIFGRSLMQGCRKECPVERKKTERGPCRDEVLMEKNASMVPAFCAKAWSAARSSLESRRNRFLIR